MIPSDKPARIRRQSSMDDIPRASSMQRSRTSASRGMEKGSIDRPSDHVRRATSTHRSSSMRQPRDSSNNNVCLEASSYHVRGATGASRGSTTTSSSSSSSSSNRRAGGPSRSHRSSDNMELLGNNGLGAATMHGSSSVSRIRSAQSSRTLDSHLSANSQRGSSNNKTVPADSAATAAAVKKTSDRRTLKRAMSRDNVKPPEEYASASNANGTSRITAAMHPQEPRRGRRRPGKHQEPAVVEEEDEDDISTTNEDNNHDDDDVCSTSSDESGSSFGEESDAESFIQQQPASKSSSDKPRRSSFASRSTASSSSSASTTSSLQKQLPKHNQQQQQQQQQQPASTNILQLMREEKKVQLHDLQDKKNRRVLHFLLYQHKLGVNMAQLHQDIHDDIATNGVEQALSRPPLPLYVEPAN